MGTLVHATCFLPLRTNQPTPNQPSSFALRPYSVCRGVRQNPVRYLSLLVLFLSCSAFLDMMMRKLPPRALRDLAPLRKGLFLDSSQRHYLIPAKERAQPLLTFLRPRFLQGRLFWTIMVPLVIFYVIS